MSDDEILVESDENENVDAVKPPVKKRPGRPPKIVIKKTIPKVGIVPEPSNLNKVSDPRLINVLELLYDNPPMFKKVFGLYKSMNSEFVRIRCEADMVKIHSKDGTGASDIYTVIYGTKMNQYYLKKTLEFGIGLNDIYKIFTTLSKEHSRVAIYTSSQYERQKIKIGLSDDDFEEDGIFDVEMEALDDYDWHIETELADEENYPIKFELPFKRFKKKVNDFRLLGEVMRIEKYGYGPLKLNYNFTNNKGSHNSNFKNPAKINLRSLIGEKDIFSTSVCLDHIKPLAGSLITDTIQISADINKRLIFTALLDHDIDNNKKKVYGTEKCKIKIITNFVQASNAS